MTWMNDPSAYVALLSLVALELVLGIDNIIFISILSGKLPKAQQPKARQIGLALAMILRIGLLCLLSWIVRLTAPLFSVWHHAISGRDLILIIGGLFLMAKSTFEIHERLEGDLGHQGKQARAASFGAVIFQILLLDIVFSLDSVITAVGMVDQISIMVIAVMVAVGCMMALAGPIGEFVHQHPSVKMLALSFLLLIGVNLMAEGLHQHIPKGYIYFAMAFSVFVELLNLRLRAVSVKPVELRGPEAVQHG